MTAGRRKIMCSVPGCPHWCLPRALHLPGGLLWDTEVICRQHWQAIPIKYRRTYRRARNYFAAQPCIETNARCHRLWRWLKRRAIERGVGI